MKTLIRATEVWLPSEDGLMLEFGSGLFANATLAGISRQMCFGRAEGLPGQAWDEGRPILLKQFEGSNFRRTNAARAAGLGCAVAIPTFAGERLTSVLVLFFGDDTAERCAIELWRNDPRVAGDMTLVDGRYGRHAGALEALPRATSQPRDSGLPGRAWQRSGAVFTDDLAAASPALRGNATQGAGPLRGLALPCPVRGQAHEVLTLLAPAETPIALRIEAWAPDASRASLQRRIAHGAAEGTLHDAGASLMLDRAGGPVASAFAGGVAALSANAGAEPGPIGAAAAACGATSLVAVPVFGVAEVTEVLALYF